MIELESNLKKTPFITLGSNRYTSYTKIYCQIAIIKTFIIIIVNTIVT